MKKYITKQSNIKGAGKGLFTKESFKKGEVIGLAHVDDQPASEIGRNHNHNEKNPTAYSKKIDNKRFIYASRNLNPGEEITTNYRMQPELEQPEDFMRKGGAVLKMPNKKNSKGYSRSLSATNKLFTQNFLFAKPKSRKNKVFDPNSKYYAEGGEPCSSEKQIYPEYSMFGCISLSQYNNLKEQIKANEKKQKLYKETLLKDQSALKASINNQELYKKLYAEYQTKYPGQSSVCPNGKCPVDDLVLEPEVENLPILKPGLIDSTKDELQGNTLNEEVESEYLEEGSPDTENAMEWVNKRKYNIDWNGIQIPYRLPRFRKPGSYGDLIKPGKKRYINLPTIESRNTAYLTPKKQDGGLHKFVDGGKPCSDEEYWDGENCVPKEKDSSPIMQNPSWQQEPVVNPAAYVSGYRGGNPKMYKYGFIDSDQGNIVGGGGFGFPKPGVHLSALGVVPTSSNDKQYFKGAYEASISKDIKNLNLGLGVNTAITGYPGENGFVRDPIKLQPKLNLKYNFEEGGALLDDYIEVDLDEDEIEEYRRGGFIVEEIDNYQDGGAYTVKGSDGVYKKVNGKWQVDWNKSGKYQPLSKGDVKARTAILDKMAKPLYDKDYDEMVAYKNLSAEDKINKFIPKKEATKEDYESISNKLSRNYKPENTKLQSVNMVYPERYLIGPGGGLAGLGMKASKAAFAFKPISYLPSVGKALTYHSVYDAGTEHVPNTVKLLSNKSEWNNDKSVDLFKNLFKITSTAAGFSKYDQLKYFNRARNVGQLIDKTTDANKDALKGTKMLKNFVTTFKKYGGQQF